MRTAIFSIGTALTLWSTSAAFGQEVPAKATQALAATSIPEQAIVSIPFEPPFDIPLNYRIVRTITDGGSTRSNTVEQRLTYRRQDHSLTLTIETLNVGDGANQFTVRQLQQMAGADAGAALSPVTLELDSGGLPLQVQDWERHREALRASIDLAAMSEPPARRAEARALAERAMAPFLAMKAEQASEWLVRGWPAILGLGLQDFEEGQPLSTSVEVPAPQLPLPITYAVDVMVERNFGGQIVYTRTQTPNQAALRESVARYLDSVAGDDNPQVAGHLTRFAEEMASIEIGDQIEVVLDPVSGIVDSARIHRFAKDVTTGRIRSSDITTIDHTD